MPTLDVRCWTLSVRRFPLSTLSYQPSTSPVLFVRNLFHPLDQFSVQRFLNGNVRHRGRWRGAVPMLLTKRESDHITGRSVQATSNTSTILPNHSSLCWVNLLHVLFRHTFTLHFDFRELSFDLPKIRGRQLNIDGS